MQPQEPQVELLDDRTLAVRGAFFIREAIKEIPGRRWDAARSLWLLPRSPFAARALLSVVPSAIDVPEVVELAGHVAPGRRTDPELDEPLDNHSPVGPAWLHQTRAARWLLGNDAALLQYGMRTGKTRSTLDAARAAGARLILVLAPLRACMVWQREAEAHHPGYFRVVRLDRRSIQQRAAQLREEVRLALAPGGQPAVIALNYEAAWRPLLSEPLLSIRWDVLVLDECHRIKSPGSHQSKFCGRLQRAARRRWALSGTPLAHSPMDAYAIFRALDPGIFGTAFGAFRSRYAILGGYLGREVVGYRNLEEFRERYFSITLAASRDVLDLPEAIHETVVIELPAEARRLHAQVKDHAMAMLASGDGEIVATNVLTQMLRMCQIASGHTRVDDPVAVTDGQIGIFDPEAAPAAPGGPRTVEVHRAKEEAVVEILGDLDPREPVVVFCRFRHDLDQVERATAAAGRLYRELSGRRNDLEDWLGSAGGEVLGVQYQAGGEGIDLARASYCILYNDTFELAKSDQAIARIHGPKSRNRVVYFHLVARGTIDEYVRDTLVRRRDVIARVLDERALGNGGGGAPIIDEDGQQAEDEEEPF
jgi:SNF2 family DNA or RNA helicase